MDFGVEKIDLAKVQFTPELLQTVSPTIARKYRVVPVFVAPDSLCIALADASDMEVIDELLVILGRSLDIRVVEPEQLDRYIEKCYGQGG